MGFLVKRKSARSALCFAFLCASFCIAGPLTVSAQWISDSTTNTAVCIAAGIQEQPIACSDGRNGAVIAWQDGRNGATAIYAQRLDSNGKCVWADKGVMLASSPSYSQFSPQIASDDSGGAYVIWSDLRGISSLYAQHIRADGTLQYPSTGLSIGSGSNARSNPVICDDGRGGAFVAWEDYRASKSNHRPDIYMNRLWPGGARFSAGSLIDTAISVQRYPAICNDGNGGCFIAWQSGSTIPSSIYATRLDSGSNPLWGLPGTQVYEMICGDCSYANSSHVAIGRDGKQLMLAWEITSSSSVDTQNIMATRMRCSTPTDISQVWGHPIEVTGEMLYDQTNPQIFSDDSSIAVGNEFRGILVPFENQKPSSSDDWDVSMVRVLGSGSAQLPGNYGSYDFVNQSHGQTGFRAVKSDSGIIAVWNDSRFYGGTGPDTCIYAQLIDKYGVKRFPSYGTKTKWGMPICHGFWMAKQVTMAPRTNGAIIAWTDYRVASNDPSIYAQLLFRDGSLPIELTSFDARCRYRGQVDLTWKTASEQENAGFEIERRNVSHDGEDFVTIAGYENDNALRGAGSSNYEIRYAWTDRSVEPAIYEYRLVEVAFDGTRITHEVKRVDGRFGELVEGWSVGPNFPNPFGDQTTLPMSIPVDAVIDLSISDISGRTVANPIHHQFFSRGVHEIALKRDLCSASGDAVVHVTAYDASTGQRLWQLEKPIIMVVIH